MKCEFEYCIYNKNFECGVSNPEIDSLGMCSACIVISLNKKFLEKEKELQLLKLELSNALIDENSEAFEALAQG